MAQVIVHPEMKVVPYYREIPRDLFNEAKLLKCMGLLALRIHDNELPPGLQIVMQETRNPFEIALTNAQYLFISNYQVRINGTQVFFATTQNSLANWPLVCFIGNDEISVFDDKGYFTEEFAGIKI